MIYIDTSVLMAHIFSESTRPKGDFWSGPLVSSQLLQYEAWTIIHREKKTRSLGGTLTDALARVDLVNLAPAVLRRALNPFPVHVRTLDGLHLATLAYLNADGPAVPLATYDRRMADAARALGIALVELK